MILSITNRTPDASDLDHLLHKHPARCYEGSQTFGKATVFYERHDSKRQSPRVDLCP